ASESPALSDPVPFTYDAVHDSFHGSLPTGLVQYNMTTVVTIKDCAVSVVDESTGTSTDSTGDISKDVVTYVYTSELPMSHASFTDGLDSCFDYSMAVLGNVMAVGCPYHLQDPDSTDVTGTLDATYSGMVYLYSRESSMATWMEVDTADITVTGSDAALFGTTLGLTRTATGVSLAVSAPGVSQADGGDATGGAVYVYDVEDLDTTSLPSLSLSATIPCPLTPAVRMATAEREAGRDYMMPLPMAVSASLIAIADHQYVSSVGLGGVHVMHLDGGAWTTTTIHPSTQSADLVYGADVAVDYSATHLAVSTRLINKNFYRDPTMTTAAYVYTVSASGECVEESTHSFAEQEDSPLDAFTQYWFSVALSDTMLIIGGPDCVIDGADDDSIGGMTVYGREDPADEWLLLGCPETQQTSTAFGFSVSVVRVDTPLSQWDGTEIVVATSPDYNDTDEINTKAFIAVYNHVDYWWMDEYMNQQQWFRHTSPAIAFDGATLVTDGGAVSVEGSLIHTSVQSGPSYMRVTSLNDSVTNNSSNSVACTVVMDPCLGGVITQYTSIYIYYVMSTETLSLNGDMSQVDYESQHANGIYDLTYEISTLLSLRDGEDFGVYVRGKQDPLSQYLGAQSYYTYIRDSIVQSIPIIAASEDPTSVTLTPLNVADGTESVSVSVLDGSGLDMAPSTESPLSVAITEVDGTAVSLSLTWDSDSAAFTLPASSLPSAALSIGDHTMSVTATTDSAFVLNASLTVFADTAAAGLVFSTTAATSFSEIAFDFQASGNWGVDIYADAVRGESAVHVYYRRSQYETFEFHSLLVEADADVQQSIYFPPSVAIDGEWIVRSSYADLVDTGYDLTYTTFLTFYHLEDGVWTEAQQIAVPKAGTMDFSMDEINDAESMFLMFNPGQLHVYISGGIAVLTTPLAHDATGSAHVLTLDASGSWAYSQELEPETRVDGEVFGTVCSIDEANDRIAISTFIPMADEAPASINAAYEYERDPVSGEWFQESIVPGVTDGWWPSKPHTHFVGISGDVVIAHVMDEVVTATQDEWGDEHLQMGRTRFYTRALGGSGGSKYSYTLDKTIEGNNEGENFSSCVPLVTEDMVMLTEPNYYRELSGEDESNNGLTEVYTRDAEGSDWTPMYSLTPTTYDVLMGFSQTMSTDPVSGDVSITVTDLATRETEMFGLISFNPMPSSVQLSSCPTSLTEGSNDVSVSVVDKAGAPRSDVTVSLIITETEAGVSNSETHSLTATGTAGTYAVSGITVRDVETTASIVASLGGTTEVTEERYMVVSDSPVSVTRDLDVLFASTTIASATIDPILLAAGVVHLTVRDGRGSAISGLTNVSVAIGGGSSAEAVWDGEASYYTATLGGSVALGATTAAVTVADPTYASASLSASCHVYGTLASVTVSPTSGGTVAAGAGLDITVSLFDASGASLPPMDEYDCYVSAISDAGVDSINGGEGTTVLAVWDEEDGVYAVTSTPVSLIGDAVDVVAQCVVDGSETVDSASASVPVTVTPGALSAEHCVVSLSTNDSAAEWSEESVAAGDGFVVSVATVDAYLNPLSDETVTVSITLEDTTSTTLTSTFNADLDLFEAPSLSSFDTLAQNITVAVSVAPSTDLGTTWFVITPNPTPSATESTLSLPTEAAAGADIEVTYVPADEYGNLITQYDSVTVAFVRESATRGTLALSTTPDPE
ncbi:hypothetical protein KIPB_001758, partial [Kipferlia bialata]